MSRAQAESVIKNIIREIVQECGSKGQAVSETLVAFMVEWRHRSISSNEAKHSMSWQTYRSKHRLDGILNLVFFFSGESGCSRSWQRIQRGSHANEGWCPKTYQSEKILVQILVESWSTLCFTWGEVFWNLRESAFEVRSWFQVCVERLLDTQSPALDTIKMQVYFDMNYTSRSSYLHYMFHAHTFDSKVFQRSLVSHLCYFSSGLLGRTSPSVGITLATSDPWNHRQQSKDTRGTGEPLQENSFCSSFTFWSWQSNRHHSCSRSDRCKESEIDSICSRIDLQCCNCEELCETCVQFCAVSIAAALQSVFPQTEMGTFLTLSKRDKERQLQELTMIVTGIRLFNKECAKGGEGIDDCKFPWWQLFTITGMAVGHSKRHQGASSVFAARSRVCVCFAVPAILNEAVPATNQNVQAEIHGTLATAFRYTALVEKIASGEAPADDTSLQMMKEALINTRQHATFLKIILVKLPESLLFMHAWCCFFDSCAAKVLTIFSLSVSQQNDVVSCAQQVENLESQLASRLEQLQATVQSKTAVPTAQVFVSWTLYKIKGHVDLFIQNQAVDEVWIVLESSSQYVCSHSSPTCLKYGPGFKMKWSCSAFSATSWSTWNHSPE